MLAKFEGGGDKRIWELCLLLVLEPMERVGAKALWRRIGFLARLLLLTIARVWLSIFLRIITARVTTDVVDAGGWGGITASFGVLALSKFDQVIQDAALACRNTTCEQHHTQ